MTYANLDLEGKILHRTKLGNINAGMVDVAEREVGGENQLIGETPKSPRGK